jgi:hypothetical protein
MGFKEREGGTVTEGLRKGIPELLKDQPPRVDSLLPGTELDRSAGTAGRVKHCSIPLKFEWERLQLLSSTRDLRVWAYKGNAALRH